MADPEGTHADSQKDERLWVYGHLRRLLSRLEVTCVLDVGAHVGEFAQQVRALAGYEGWILSFEPLSDAYRQLSELCERQEHWNAIQVALGSREEERPIQVPEANVFSSFLEPSEYGSTVFGLKTDSVMQETVSVRTLDSIAPTVLDGIPDDRLFLKVDTQGWDLEVFRGAEDTLSRVVGLQTELSIQPIYRGTPHYTATLSYLESKGFDLSGLFPVVRDRHLRLVEVDCVMVRAAEVSAP